MDLREGEPVGHTSQVTEMTVQFARAHGIRGEDLMHIKRGALLHDIGKMGISEQILRKPGKLTEEEWVIMHMHLQNAYDLLAPILYTISGTGHPLLLSRKMGWYGLPARPEGRADPAGCPHHCRDRCLGRPHLPASLPGSLVRNPGAPVYPGAIGQIL